MIDCGILTTDQYSLGGDMPEKIDMTGRVFGRLSVVRSGGISQQGAALWVCQCECGNTVTTDGRRLRRGATVSCGCFGRERSAVLAAERMRGKPNINRVDLTGQRFGRWSVVRMDESTVGRQIGWICRCDCGTERSVRGNRLRSGRSSSCGCDVAERAAARMIGKTGALNGMWKGEAASYFAKHMRVNAIRGRPPHCEECGLSDSTRFYDWANLTGNYDDVYDYRRMCRPCHRKYDASRRLSTLPARAPSAAAGDEDGAGRVEDG